MAGTFSPGTRPRRPGAYFNFVGTERPVVLSGTGSVVAVPFTSDWGPVETPVTLDRWEDYLAIFGDSLTPGYKAVKQAFQGEGLSGRGGAGQVVALRFGGTGIAPATVNVSNGTQTNALVVNARYSGSFGSRISFRVNTAVSGNTRYDVLLDGAVVESYTYASTNITALGADLVANSDYVTATVNNTGTALVVGTTALVGGNDGSTLVAADWTRVRTILDDVRFGIVAPFDLTDAAVVASFKTWAATHQTSGKRFMVVIGGPNLLTGANNRWTAGTETTATANSRSTTQNHESFVNIGGAMVQDAQLGVLNTAQLAPRVAGIIAARGETRGLTYARFAGLTLLATVAADEIVTSFDSGTIVLTKDMHPDAPVRIEKGVTTYTGGDAAKPKAIYSVPKFVRTMQNFEMEFTEWAENNVIGLLPVNEATRTLVMGEALSRLAERRTNGSLAAATVNISSSPPPSDTDDFVSLDYAITFARGLEQILNTVRIA